MPFPRLNPARAMTDAERQARRRGRLREAEAGFRDYRIALAAIRDDARSLDEARAIADGALKGEARIAPALDWLPDRRARLDELLGMARRGEAAMRDAR